MSGDKPIRRADPRLGVMMFLQFAVWGIWLPQLPTYLRRSTELGGLGFEEWQVGLIASVATAIGAISAPFLGGQFADRYFSTERYLGVCMILGAAVNWALSSQTSFTSWLILSVVYAVIYIPTIGLTTSLALGHLDDPKHQYPRVRVFGTIAWIVVSWVFPLLWLKASVQGSWLPPFYEGPDRVDAVARIADTLKASAIISLVYGIFCFWLPSTPPQRTGVKKLAFARAFALTRYRSVSVLMLAAVLISIIHKIYFLQTSSYLEDAIGLKTSDVAPAMSIGQFAEIVVMVVLGGMLTRFGFRGTMALGALCYFIRYAVFGTTFLPAWMIIGSQFLHGFCFACFYAAAFMYIDRMAPADVKHSAQTSFTIIMFGLGPILGAVVNTQLDRWFTSADGSLNYQWFWYACALIGLLATIIVLVAFRDESGDDAAGKD